MRRYVHVVSVWIGAAKIGEGPLAGTRAGLRQSPMLESPEQLLCLVRIDIEAVLFEAARLSFGTVRYDRQIEVSIAQIDRLPLGFGTRH